MISRPVPLEWNTCSQRRLGNRVNRVYPRGQLGGYAPILNLARWLPRGCTDVFCTQNPKKTGYPTVPRKYRVFETHPGRTQRRFTRVKPVLPNPVPKSESALPILMSLSSWTFSWTILLPQALVLSSVYFAYIVRPLQSWRLIYSASTILKFKLAR